VQVSSLNRYLTDPEHQVGIAALHRDRHGFLDRASCDVGAQSPTSGTTRVVTRTGWRAVTSVLRL
jgi:hypothetical protein